MTDEQVARFRAHTARTNAPQTPAREAWVAAGRRGGKSRIAALVAVYLACFRDHRAVLAPGERGTLPIIAADHRRENWPIPRRPEWPRRDIVRM
jgi:hypothetical protein